jgi:Ca-activated chloride channel family protein
MATALLMLATSLGAGASRLPMQDPPRPVFRGGVDLVMVTVVVQTRNGRPVTGLRREEFQLFDAGELKAIKDFRSEPSPVSVALLFDLSGSMAVATQLADARAAGRQVLGQLDAGQDHAALFGFDTELKEFEPFSATLGAVDRALDTLPRPFGETSLYDAIAAAGRRLAAESGPRRAVVALTDGADTSSRLRPADVASLASGIDVPVYVIAVSLPLDHQGASTAVDSDRAPMQHGPLDALTRATGGALFVTSTPADANRSARQIVTDLRNQYVLSFEPGSRSGWHPLSIVTRNKDLVVRTRSGYVAGTRAGHHQ